MKQMVCFCPEDVIFVLNKWDAVDESERDECFERIKTQLHDIWEEIDDSHILELSARKVFLNAYLSHTFTILFQVTNVHILSFGH